MLKQIAIGFFFYILLAGYATAAIVAEPVDASEQHPGKRIFLKVRLSNDSDVDIKIVRNKPSFILVNFEGLPTAIPAKGSRELSFSLRVDRALGNQRYPIELDIEGDQKALRFPVNMYVTSVLDDEPQSVDFGIVPAESEAEKKVSLKSTDEPDIRAISASSSEAAVATDIVDGGRSVVLRTVKDAAWGMHDGWIEVTTNSEKQPLIWVKYEFEARGQVVPETYEVAAGLQHVHKVVPQTLFIRDTKGSPLHLGKISARGSNVFTKEISCPVKTASCRGVQIRIDDKQIVGKISSVVSIELPQFKQTLKVNYAGLLLDESTRVRDLNSEAEKQVAVDATLTNIASALQVVTTEKPAPIASPTPPGAGPLLKWNVENEQVLYGYIIRRADVENGPMRRINSSIVRALSKKDGVPVEYRWRDTTAQLGHTYWYQIGTLDMHGLRNDLTGPMKKTYVETADHDQAKKSPEH